MLFRFSPRLCGQVGCYGGRYYVSAFKVLQITVDREGGKIALNIRGKDGGSEPYTGNDLQSGTFTVTVSETDRYVIQFPGNDASGRITIKNLGIETN